MFLPGYDASSRPRPAHCAGAKEGGGGLMILVREGLPWLASPEGEAEGMLAPRDDATEIQAVQVFTRDSPPLTLVNVYSPPPYRHRLSLRRLPVAAAASPATATATATARCGTAKPFVI